MLGGDAAAAPAIGYDAGGSAIGATSRDGHGHSHSHDHGAGDGDGDGAGDGDGDDAALLARIEDPAVRAAVRRRLAASLWLLRRAGDGDGDGDGDGGDGLASGGVCTSDDMVHKDCLP